MAFKVCLEMIRVPTIRTSSGFYSFKKLNAETEFTEIDEQSVQVCSVSQTSNTFSKYLFAAWKYFLKREGS